MERHTVNVVRAPLILGHRGSSTTVPRLLSRRLILKNQKIIIYFLKATFTCTFQDHTQIVLFFELEMLIVNLLKPSAMLYQELVEVNTKFISPPKLLVNG